MKFILSPAVNNMTIPIESQKFNNTTISSTNIQSNQITPMNSNEILEVRCFYDQFYNIIMAGYPIDINVSYSFYYSFIRQNNLNIEF